VVMRDAQRAPQLERGAQMDDEGSCVFVITLCILTLALPAVAQTMFAVFGAAIVVATYIGRRARPDLELAASDRREVPGVG